MKTVAILQSNYVPWKGYFDLIAAVDEFVIYDEVQFTKNDWRNRNQIKTPQGTQWLSIPVGADIQRRICEVELPAGPWPEKHWKTLAANYGRAPYFDDVARWLKPLYLERRYQRLSELNVAFIKAICGYLGIGTKISDSSDFEHTPGKTGRLVGLCRQAGAQRYISGPAAKAYLDESEFSAVGIRVEWFDYAGYPEYPQLWGKFEHAVSVLDLLFNCGAGSPQYMRYVK
ncbi:WbqC family protein [Achromobacter pestifer]|uniref:WbqC family protein n=1 Tax=Achromobacter pestifer TaxID=1353889 RepID=A0A7D4HZJ0_9BURK|nr:WbqC family protein [Achromobacter pestifer]QKH35936.1 WbqC family protein [Achromobacter pestifer]